MPDSFLKRLGSAVVACTILVCGDMPARAQNTRTEALNLIRNRKGRTPHVVAVTLEPLPGRLASIAMGTGDVDCTYHAALNELMLAAADSDFADAYELLQTLVSGRRLRDIGDLPLDLAS